MKGAGRRNAWLRMTDSMGLTEPGKKPATPAPRILIIQTIGWFAMTLLWIGMLLQGQQEGQAQVLYGVLVVLSLVLAVGNFVMLRRSTRRTTDQSKANGSP
jgi:hypothetical protein